MRPAGWAALFATVGWASLAAPALATYVAVGTAGSVALAIAVLMPLLVSAARLVAELRTPSTASQVREIRTALGGSSTVAAVAAGGAAGLVLAGLAVALAPSASELAVGRQVGERIAALVPGPSLGWAFVAAGSLTAVASSAAGHWRLPLALITSSTLLAGGVFLWAGDAAAVALAGARPGACGDPLPAMLPAHSVATGDVDGRSLGNVVGTLDDTGLTTVVHATAWGRGTADLRDVGSGRVYTTGALGVDARAVADDVGIDRVGDGAARHCRMVIDGRTAAAAFPLLRWMVGGDQDARDVGDGLATWRGSLDYWIVRSGSDPAGRLRLATLEISGQAPDWPIGRGARATLRAASAFEVP